MSKEKFEFCGYDEEEREINIPTKRGFKPKKMAAAVMLGMALVTGLSGVPSTSMTEINPYVVEAKTTKKDKKKPVITYKDKNIKEVEKGESVNNLGATAKDNKDGNVTKKITVTVKKGKKSYKSIAKKIKNNKSVKFTSTGTYKITYTVKDKAGNKATKTRTVKVVAPKNKTTTTTQATTQQPTTEKVTTEVPTTQTPTTEKVTTEQPTTETPTTEEVTVPTDFSKYDVKQVEVNGNTYNIITDSAFEPVVKKVVQPTIDSLNGHQEKVKVYFENNFNALLFAEEPNLIENYQFLRYVGKISAEDQYGNDISDKVYMYIPTSFNEIDKENKIYTYVEDDYGNAVSIFMETEIRKLNDELYRAWLHESALSNGYYVVDDDPLVYGLTYEKIIEGSNNNSKKLELSK